MMKSRRECPHYDYLGYDFPSGSYEAHCKLAPKGLYCIHEGNPKKCPLDGSGSER